MNDFEHRLQGEQPRQIPPTWREDILRQARAAAETQETAATGARPPQTGWLRSAMAALRNHLTAPGSPSLAHSLLWPHPKAWATLAALWMAIGCLHWASKEPAAPTLASNPVQPASRSSVELLCLAEQLRLQRELLGVSPARPMDPVDRRKTQPTPKPHSAATPDYRIA